MTWSSGKAPVREERSLPLFSAQRGLSIAEVTPGVSKGDPVACVNDDLFGELDLIGKFDSLGREFRR
jgi:hypothetical protein